MTSSQLQPVFILDISRLLSRADCLAPTGIDRVELAYAQYLLEYHEKQLYFASYSLLGRINILPKKISKKFIISLINGWSSGNKKYMAHAYKMALCLKFCFSFIPSSTKIFYPSIYLLLSHHHLTHKNAIQRFLVRTKSYFVPMVHDLIPLEYPEYSRQRELSRHRARIKTVIALAKAVVVPTETVATSLKSFSTKNGQDNTPIWAVPHGINIRNSFKETLSDIYNRPYFIYLSTIEPRKNHLMLLHLWRAMVQKHGEAEVPYLVLVGKRGWENENILDLLDRSPALQNSVKEKNNLSDEEVTALLKRANGLLFPSFTEGYGLPLVEAMYLQVPSICADIPALREVGGDIPYYIDPLDTPNWEIMIDDFRKHGPLWQNQMEKLKTYEPLSWDGSVAQTVENCISLIERNSI